MVSNVLFDETVRWSGSPGFVATFNSQEFLSALIITVIFTITATILMGNTTFPVQVSALLAAFVCSMSLLLVGWVRQVIRYAKTIGMYYAVTESRLVIIKHKRIVAEMSVESIESKSISRKFWGNGSIVFNQGDDYLENHMIEAPTNKVFVFFNVLDIENVLKEVSL